MWKEKKENNYKSNFQVGERKGDERSLTSLSNFLKIKYILWKLKWVEETGEETILAMEKLKQWLEVQHWEGILIYRDFLIRNIP